MPAGDKLEYKLKLGAQQPVGLPKFSFFFIYEEEIIKRIEVFCVVGGLL